MLKRRGGAPRHAPRGGDLGEGAARGRGFPYEPRDCWGDLQPGLLKSAALPPTSTLKAQQIIITDPVVHVRAWWAADAAPVTQGLGSSH